MGIPTFKKEVRLTAHEFRFLLLAKPMLLLALMGLVIWRNFLIQEADMFFVLKIHQIAPFKTSKQMVMLMHIVSYMFREQPAAIRIISRYKTAIYIMPIILVLRVLEFMAGIIIT